MKTLLYYQQIPLVTEFSLYLVYILWCLYSYGTFPCADTVNLKKKYRLHFDIKFTHQEPKGAPAAEVVIFLSLTLTLS